MFEMLGEFVSSSAFGGLFGVLGNWLNQIESRKQAKLKHDHEIQLAEFQLKEMQFEANHELAMVDKQIERSRLEGEIERDVAETNAFTNSLKSQLISTGVKWVDAIRGLVRPLITLYALLVITLIALKLFELVGGFEYLGQEKLYELFNEVIRSLLFIATTATVWWFGSRAKAV